MLIEVAKNIFLNEVVLPSSPLKALNSYIIKGNDRSLIIDTGFNVPQAEKSFFEGIEESGTDIRKCDLFLTHLHADHTGLADKFQQRSSGKVYCSKTDAAFIDAMANGSYFKIFLDSLKLFGIEADVSFFHSHPAVRYCAKDHIDYTFCEEDDVFEIGDYSLRVVGVSGHTPGQLNLYDEKKRIYFSADHILAKITPNISFWGFEYGDILGTYLKNLKKVRAMDIDLILSSHRSIITDPKTRIDQLLSHHDHRLAEILELLKKDSNLTVYQVAKGMHWDFRAESFDEFPNAQKWFACSEAMSHLEHLRSLGMISSVNDGEILTYSMV